MIFSESLVSTLASMSKGRLFPDRALAFPRERDHGHLSSVAEFSLCARGYRAARSAYEDCLRTLKVRDGSNPTTELLAKKIIELAQTGIRDPGKLGRLALEEIGTSGSE